ncbi:MAG: hypothetical protein GF341_12265 [candidate division Zixibacteria bacterium]|nr:hypothetical protein [candidate division Zixibacteria bacterium]
MSVSVLLNDPYRHWVSLSENGWSIHFCGYVVRHGHYLSAETWTRDVLKDLGSRAWGDAVRRLKKTISDWNGCWAIVIEHDSGGLFCATDRVRGIPLFYHIDDGRVTVSSTTTDLLPRVDDHRIDDASAVELLLGGFVLGNRTLVSGIHKLKAAEYLELSPDEGMSQLRIASHYQFLPAADTVTSPESRESELHDRLDAALTPLTHCSDDRTLLVSLSGGLDSRLALAILHRQGARNLTAFTYGPETFEDVCLAQEVTDTLGIPHIRIPYTPEVWQSWIDSPRMRNYWHWAGQCASLPHIQDLPALDAVCRELADRPSAVVVTGHSGDFLAGSHISFELSDPDKRYPPDQLAQIALRWNLNNWATGESEWAGSLRARIAEDLVAYRTNRHIADAECVQAWELDNRTSQFIVNNVRAYEFMKCDWSLPLFDYGLMDLFANTPLCDRIGQRLYVATAQNRIFTGRYEPLGRIPTTRGSTHTGRSKHHHLKRLLNSLRLLETARQLSLRRQSAHPLAFDSWFADAENPRLVTVGDLLERRDVLGYLTPSTKEIVGSSRHRRLSQMRPNGLLAAVYLAETGRELCS